MSFAVIGVGGIDALLKGARSLVSAIRSAPAWMKAVLLVAVIGCAFHPRARAKIGEVLSALLNAVGDVFPQFLSVISQAAAVADTQGALARDALATAVTELERAGQRARSDS